MSSLIYPLIALLIAVVVVLDLTRSTDGRGTLNRGGESAPATGSEQSNRFTVSAWNIHRGRDAAGTDTFADMPPVLADSDVMALQEVGGAGWGEGPNQARLIAEALGEREWFFAPTRLRWFRPKGGNALVSRLPLQNVVQESLESGRRDYRNFLAADLIINGQSVRIIAVHLATRDLREAQLSRVIGLFSAHPRAILIGDLNTRPGDPGLQPLHDMADVVDAISTVEARQGESWRKAADVDWIFVKGLEVENARVEDEGLSDHPFWHATLRLRDIP